MGGWINVCFCEKDFDFFISFKKSVFFIKMQAIKKNRSTFFSFSVSKKKILADLTKKIKMIVVEKESEKVGRKFHLN